MMVRDLRRCPACAVTVVDGAAGLASHLVAQAEGSDVGHVMWLNRNITKHRLGAGELAQLLGDWAATGRPGEDTVAR